jgi:fibronectin type 3 domain-containing protein
LKNVSVQLGLAGSGFAHHIHLATVCTALVFLAACSGGGSGGGGTTDTTPPTAPTGLGATAASGTQINLAWTASTDDVGVTGYRVERCQGAGCANFAQIATPTTTSFNDTGLSDATSYSYRVRATDAAGNLGAYSSSATAVTPDTTPPTAPATLSATPVSTTQINLTWNAATDNVGVTGYRVERCQGASCSTFAQIATPSATNFSDTGLTASTNYSYQVRAVDAAGNPGPYSNVASATTLPPAPVAPTGVSATPGNAQAILSWPAVTGATSYNVYSSATSPVTTGGTKTTVSTPGATLSALTNGTAVYAAVTAVNVSGESPLSAGVCAVPTTANTSGVTLYDPLCEDALDGQKWQAPQFSRGVSGGAMVLSAQAGNIESRTIKSQVYATSVNVNSSGQRVSTLKADVTVPAAGASHTGNADIRAVVQITYQPPATRLQFPGANLDALFVQIGLADNATGSGLRVFRRIFHNNDASGISRSTTDIALVDPAGFTADAQGIGAEAAAAYDTTYTLSASLNESTGIFTWSVAGGTFGGGVSGTGDPSVYLAGNSNWTGVPLAGAGFSFAGLRTTIADSSVTAGSDAKVSAKFANVQVGFNNAVATLFDDFSGSGGTSGPTELSAAKWTAPGGAAGEASMALSAGSLSGHSQATSPTTAGVSSFQALSFNNPETVQTMQTDVTITACSNTFAGAGATNRVQLQGDFYNDGTSGPNTPPNTNQANSSVGDVRAFLMLDCVANTARFSIFRFDTQTTGTSLSNFANSAIPLGTAVTGNTHTLMLKWDPTAKLFTFQVDGGTAVVVDPTTVNSFMTAGAPVIKAPNVQVKQLVWGVSVPPSISPSAAGATASIDFSANNVFIAP